MLNVISVVFIVMIILYIIFNFRNMYYVDTLMLVTAVLILGFTVFNNRNSKKHLETFTSDNTLRDMILQDLSPLQQDEDPSIITKTASVYLTVFNNKSYPGSGKEIYNLAFKENSKTCSTPNKTFNLENIVTFDRVSGIVMNTNRIVGPFSNNLGIQMQGAFSMFFTCKHGSFVSNNESEVEFLKLYANSENNNGLALFIPSNTIVTSADNQTARLTLMFGHRSYPCTIPSSTQQTMSFDKTNITSYFIVKQTDSITVYSLVGDAAGPTKILEVALSESTDTFSNKEFVMNRFRNYKGSVYQVGVIPAAISTQDVQRIHNHCTSQYKKVTSADYVAAAENYNKMLEYLKSFTNCPFNTDTCSNCTSITNWTDTTQLLTASADCRKAINTFCRDNPKHFRCQCWDTNGTQYNTTSCKMYRGIFDPDRAMYDNLSQDDINYVKNKYTLIRPEDCPKPVIPDVKSCVNENLVKNTYQEYDFNKVKIDPKSLNKLSPGTSPGIIHKPYTNDPSAKMTLQERRAMGVGEESTSTSSSSVRTTSTTGTRPPLRDSRLESNNSADEMKNYSFKEIKLGADTEDKSKSNTNTTYSIENEDAADVSNIYQTDPNLKFDPADNLAFKELNETAKLEEKQSPFMSTLSDMFFPTL